MIKFRFNIIIIFLTYIKIIKIIKYIIYDKFRLYSDLNNTESLHYFELHTIKGLIGVSSLLYPKVFEDLNNWFNCKNNRNSFIDCEIEVKQCQDRGHRRNQWIRKENNLEISLTLIISLLLNENMLENEVKN